MAAQCSAHTEGHGLNLTHVGRNWTIYDGNSSIPSLVISIIVVSSIASTLTVISNLTTIVVIVKRGLMGRCVCIFVASTAMCDVIQGLLVLPAEIVGVMTEEDIASCICKLQFYFMYLVKTATFYTLCLYAAIKTYSMLISSSGHCISAGRCMFFVSFIWLFSASYNIWTIVFYTSKHMREFTIFSSNGTVTTVLDVSSKSPNLSPNYFYSIVFNALNSLTEIPNVIAFHETPQSNFTYISISVCTTSKRFSPYLHIFAVVDIIIIYLFPVASFCIFIFIPFCKITPKCNSNVVKEIKLPILLVTVHVCFQLPWEIVHLVMVYSGSMWWSLYIIRFVLTAMLCVRGCINVFIYNIFRQTVTRKKSGKRRYTLDVPINPRVRSRSRDASSSTGNSITHISS